jgi:hypothetical protein
MGKEITIHDFLDFKGEVSITYLWQCCIRDLLMQAIAHSKEESAEDVLDKVIDGTYRLSLVFDDDRLMGCVVFGVRAYPTGRSLVIMYLAGGKLMAWAQELFGHMEELCEKLKCSRIEGTTQDVLARYAKKSHGFTIRYFITRNI